MMNDEAPQRQWSEIGPGDPELRVHLADIDDLVRINDEAERNRWGARWSSEEALRRQVKERSKCVISPVFRNGGPVDEPASVRAYVWFVDSAEGRGRVSLIDVSETTLDDLRVATSPDVLTRVVRALLDGFELARID